MLKERKGESMARNALERKRKYRSGMIAVFLVVLLLFAVVMFGSKSLIAKNNDYIKRETQLKTQINEQYERREELKSYGQYTHTKKYVEEIAREKFGLVYPDEIIFKVKE